LQAHFEKIDRIKKRKCVDDFYWLVHILPLRECLRFIQLVLLAQGPQALALQAQETWLADLVIQATELH
jgi:hypothetical protein